MTRLSLAALVALTVGCSGEIVKSGPSMIGPDGNPIIGGGTGAGTGGVGAGAGGEGAGGVGGGDVEQPVCTDTISVGTALMRRLSHEEYRNSLGDALPAASGATVTTASAGFLEDPVSLSFRNNANFLNVGPVLAQQYMEASEAVAAQAVTNLTALLPCAPANTGAEAGCAEQFIKSFGRKLYRHTLSTDEVNGLKAVYAKARMSYDFKTGIEFLVSAMLQSPHFLYRVEIDQPGATGLRPLDGTELASRLSYLIWQSGPDETLLLAAEQGNLATKEDVEREARRLLADNKARRGFTFFEQWMDLDELPALRRNATVYPGLPTNLPDLLHQEAEAFVGATVFDGDSKLTTLLTANYTYANEALARHYGYAGVTGTSFQKVSYPSLRGGLLMNGGVLSVHDKETRTSIVKRGLRVRTEVLCQIISAPPPNVNTDLGAVDQGLSQAERLAEHRNNPACAGCHNMMDPIGVGFESIDAVGRDRTKDEGGRTIVSSGELVVAGDATGPFSDGKAMVDQLAGSQIAKDCFVQQIYRFSMGRKEEAADACSRKQLRDRFAASGGDIKDLLVGLTQTDDFLFRAVTPP